jgi:hypothetical protein
LLAEDTSGNLDAKRGRGVGERAGAVLGLALDDAHVLEADLGLAERTARW